MNQNLRLAQSIIEQNKIEAEAKRDALLSQLEQDDIWRNLNFGIRQKQVEIAFCKNSDTAKLRTELDKLLERRNKYLAEHSIQQQALLADYKCKKCNDSGMANGVRCACLRRELRKALFNSSNILEGEQSFANSTEADRHNKLVYEKCEQFCQKLKTSKYRNILVIGKTGTGKTYLMKSIANKLIEHEVEVYFTTAYSLNQMLLNVYLADIASKELYLSNLLEVEVLIVDDLGTEQILRNVTLEYLFLLLNERKERGKSTLVSTNLGTAFLRDRYEDRIFSRMADQSDTLILELVGNDKRTTKN